jgi:hypothetical protein
MLSFEKKYLKYKKKFLDLKGGNPKNDQSTESVTFPSITWKDVNESIYVNKSDGTSFELKKGDCFEIPVETITFIRDVNDSRIYTERAPILNTEIGMIVSFVPTSTNPTTITYTWQRRYYRINIDEQLINSIKKCDCPEQTPIPPSRLPLPAAESIHATPEEIKARTQVSTTKTSTTQLASEPTQDTTYRKPIGLCNVCGKVAYNVCSKCKLIFYCSKECQKIGWKTHKLVCIEKLTSAEANSEEIKARTQTIWEKTEFRDDPNTLKCNMIHIEASKAIQNGNPEHGLKLLNEIKQFNGMIDPILESSIYVTKSIAYSELGKNDKALHAVIHAIQIDDKNAYAYNILSGFYRNSGYIEKAISYIKIALTIEPNNIVFLNNYIILLISINDFDEIARVQAIIKKNRK